MNTEITDFITTQNCATICVTDEIGVPYCFNCFYTFDSDKKMIYFKSSTDTHHSYLFQKNKVIAGTILPDILKIDQIRGLQFQGTLADQDQVILTRASELYHQRHSIALSVSGEMWAIKLDSIKMTDNIKGFGTKIHWKRFNEISSQI